MESEQEQQDKCLCCVCVFSLSAAMLMNGEILYIYRHVLFPLSGCHRKRKGKMGIMKGEWMNGWKVSVVAVRSCFLSFFRVLVLSRVCNSGEKAKGDDRGKKIKIKTKRKREKQSTTVKDRFEHVLDTDDDDDHESWTKICNHDNTLLLSY